MKVQVCVGSNCTLLGAMNILDQLDDLQEIISENSDDYTEEVLEVEAIKCLGFCKGTEEKVAPIVVADGEAMIHATGQAVMEKIVNKLKK